MSTSNSNSGNPSGATPKVVVRKMPFIRPAWADEVERPALAERPGVFHTGRTHHCVLDGHIVAVWDRVGEPTNPDE